MNTRPKPPEGFDENPPLEDDFFARAKPALDDPELARILAGGSVHYVNALRRIIEAHDRGEALDGPISDARRMLPTLPAAE